MSFGMDMFKELEQQTELQQAENLEHQLTQMMKDNLESNTPGSELPDWIRENLEGGQKAEPFTDNLEQTERKLESTKTFGEVVREFFQRPPLEASDAAEARYDVDEATDVWHLQTEPFSCANACQEFIIDEFLGIDVQEADLNAYARENNWLRADGTGLEDVGNLLEAYGIQTHRYLNAGFEDIKAALNNGDRVIVAVHNAALDESWWDIIPVVSANHAVEVIGIDETNPRDVKVIVNDPGVADGRGKVVSLDTFNQARDGSGGFMVVAERP